MNAKLAIEPSDYGRVRGTCFRLRGRLFLKQEGKYQVSKPDLDVAERWKLFRSRPCIGSVWGQMRSQRYEAHNICAACLLILICVQVDGDRNSQAPDTGGRCDVA